MMNMHSSVHADSKAGRRFWLAHVRALAESGFSRREYCRHHQLSYDCLTYWVHKHRSGAEPAQLPALVEVALRPEMAPRPSSAALRLHLCCGRMLEIEPHFDPAALVAVLGALERR